MKSYGVFTPATLELMAVSDGRESLFTFQVLTAAIKDLVSSWLVKRPPG